MRFVLSDPESGLGSLQQVVEGTAIPGGSNDTPMLLLDGVQGIYDVSDAIKNGVAGNPKVISEIKAAGLGAGYFEIFPIPDEGDTPIDRQIIAFYIRHTGGVNQNVLMYYALRDAGVPTVRIGKEITLGAGAAASLDAFGFKAVHIPRGCGLWLNLPATGAGETWTMTGYYREAASVVGVPPFHTE